MEKLFVVPVLVSSLYSFLGLLIACPLVFLLSEQLLSVELAAILSDHVAVWTVMIR